MVDIKKYIWTTPLVAGIIGIIGIVTPAASVNFYATDFHYWMWGFVVFKTYPPFVPEDYIGFTTNASQLIILSICALLILISAIVLIITAIIFKKQKIYRRIFENLWIICCLIIFGATISWIILVEYPSAPPLGVAPPGMSFWNVFVLNFGSIGPFISSGLVIAGMAMHRHYMRGERIPEEKERNSEIKKN